MSAVESLAGARVALWLDRPLAASKFAQGVLRFARGIEVRAIIAAGNRAPREEHPLASSLPVIASVAEAVELGADVLLIGVCPVEATTSFPAPVAAAIRQAAALGLRVVNPLHVTAGDDPDVDLPPGRMIDLRRDRGRRLFADLPRRSLRVLCAGTDCAVGKMTTALFLTGELCRRGWRVSFLGTGQTGILIALGGVPVDHIEGDFMAGAVEAAIAGMEEESDLIVIEGQASLLHPAYSGVAAALLHGSSPQAVVIADDARRPHLKFFPGRPVPTVGDEWRAIRALCRPGPVPRLLGIARIGGGARRGDPRVPVCDPLRDGVEVLAGRIADLLAGSCGRESAWSA